MSQTSRSALNREARCGWSRTTQPRSGEKCGLTHFSPPVHLKFDLICANLISDLLIAEREKINGLLQPGGSLILAGILKSQFAGVRRAYEKLGMTLRKAKVEKEWQSGHFFFNLKV